MSRKVSGPVVLVVLDGWGLREDKTNNGVALAKTPNFDRLIKEYPFTQLKASGEAVGLPEGQIGNSEVGHTAIGAGKVIYQDLVRITKDFNEGNLGKNSAFAQVFGHVNNRKSTLHVIGILSPGGVHGHEDHFMAVAKAAVEEGINVVLHPFLDGRDTPRTSGIESLKKLEDFAINHGCEIGTVIGRYYAMDRDTNWERTDAAVRAIFEGKTDHEYSKQIVPSEILQELYEKEQFDEHIKPLVFGHLGVKNGDGIVFTNFRSDRAKQLTVKICEQVKQKDLCLVTMTDYGGYEEAIVAFTPETKGVTLGEALSVAGIKQLHVAETEKFAHVTYFFNGGREQPFDGEHDELIPSRKDVATHDLAPEMRAKEITDAVIERLGSNDFVFMNYANPDMVGHTAKPQAIITAVETVDRELGRIVEAVLAKNGAVIAIADHGNAEVMVDPITGEPHTAHTNNPVPCILISQNFQVKLETGGGLIDVAPTVLELLGVNIPDGMTGSSLI